MFAKRNVAALSAVLVFTLEIALGVITCTSGSQGVRVLYDKPHGKRLPAGQVAQVLPGDLKGWKGHLVIYVDPPENRKFFADDPVFVNDTLEMLPGMHRLCVRVVLDLEPKRVSRRSRGSTYYTDQRGSDMVFTAAAGQQYEFKVLKYTLNELKLDIVDIVTQESVVHERGH